MEPLLARVSEVAQMLGLSRSKTYEVLAKGEIPGVVRIGASVRVSIEALKAWINEQTR